MIDFDRYMDFVVTDSHQKIELDFMNTQYDGPRGFTVKLSDGDAYSLMLDLTDAFNLKAVPKDSIVLDRCDGDCDWCPPDCSNRRRRLRLVEDPAKANYDPASTPSGTYIPAARWYDHIERRRKDGDREF